MVQENKKLDSEIEQTKNNSFEQLKQIRQNIHSQIVAFKKDINQINKQSIKTMDHSINSVLLSQVSESQAILAQQKNTILQQMEMAMKDAEGKITDASKAISETTIIDPINTPTLSEQYLTSNQAMENARKCVEQAMESAQNSVEAAEKMLNNLAEKK